MDRAIGYAMLGLVLSTAPMAHGQSTPDPVSRITLMGAAFDHDPVAAPPPGEVTAMAFLPGRGVVRWAVGGKTPEEAQEAQIEAMGLADARAVQREIDAAVPAKPVRLSKTRSAPATTPEPSNGPTPIDPKRRSEDEAAVNKGTRDRVAAVLGVHDGATMKDRPRVYAFAAVSGQGMGLNMLHDETGWRNAGLTTDRGGFTGERQAGLAWRTGPAQTSLSYVADKSYTQILGMQSIKDHRLMLTMALTPQVIVGLFKAP
jgi:hypothetical protein